MRRILAQWLNARGNQKRAAGKVEAATRYFESATRVDPTWSVPWYNLGLGAKYRRQWKDSLRFNQRALDLDPKDEAAWWNLGIAATALHEWNEARRAWRGFGLEIDDGPGEVSTPHVTACVRIDPQNSGEVVWGKRLDAARIGILSVPLPQSGHRYHDIVLNDGAANGTRMLKGVQVPVFDELTIWQASEYSTFEVSVQVSDESARQKLIELCEDADLGLEDWSSIQFICAECSKGNLGQHDCKATDGDGTRNTFGFAALNRDDVNDVLREWGTAVGGVEFGEVKLVLAANENPPMN